MAKVNQAPTGAIFMNNDGSIERYYGTIENGKYTGKRRRTSLLESVYCMAYGTVYVYGKCVWNAIDRFGEKLEHLIDNDFFAGVVWTLAVMTAWEVLTR